MKNAPGPVEQQVARAETAAAAAPSTATEGQQVADEMQRETTVDGAMNVLVNGSKNRGSNSGPRKLPPGVTRKSPPSSAKSAKWGPPPAENAVNAPDNGVLEQTTSPPEPATESLPKDTLTALAGRNRGSNSRRSLPPGVRRKSPPPNAKSAKWGPPPAENAVNAPDNGVLEQTTLPPEAPQKNDLNIGDLAGTGFADGIELPGDEDPAEAAPTIPVTKTAVYSRADFKPMSDAEKVQAYADSRKRKQGPIVRQPALQPQGTAEVTPNQTDAVNEVAEVAPVADEVQEREGQPNEVGEPNAFLEAEARNAQMWQEAQNLQPSGAEDPSTVDQQMAEAIPTGSVSVGEAMKRDLRDRFKSAMQGSQAPGVTNFGGQGDEVNMGRQMSAQGVSRKTEGQRFREWAGGKMETAKEAVHAAREELGLAAIQADMLRENLRAIPGLVRAGIGRKLNAAGEGTRVDYGGQHLSQREMAQYQRPLTQEEIDAKIAEKVAQKYASKFDGATDDEVKEAIQEQVNRAKAEVGLAVAKIKEKIDPRDPRFPSKEDIRAQNEYAKERGNTIEAALVTGVAQIEPIRRFTGSSRLGEVTRYHVTYSDGRKSQYVDASVGEALISKQQLGERIQSKTGLERARELMDQDLALVEVTRFGKVIFRDAFTNELILDESGNPLAVTQKEAMDADLFGVAFAEEQDAIKLTKTEISEHEEAELSAAGAQEGEEVEEPTPEGLDVSTPESEAQLENQEANSEREVSVEEQALERAQQLDRRLDQLTIAQVRQSSLLLNQLIKPSQSVEQFVTNQIALLEDMSNGAEEDAGAWQYINQWIDEVDAEITRVGGSSNEQQSTQDQVVQRVESLFGKLEADAGRLESMSNEALTKFIAITDKAINEIRDLGREIEQSNPELFARLSQTIESVIQFIETKRNEAEDLLDTSEEGGEGGEHETNDELEQAANEIVNKVEQAIGEFEGGEVEDATYNSLLNEVMTSEALNIGQQLLLIVKLITSFINAVSRSET